MIAGVSLKITRLHKVPVGIGEQILKNAMDRTQLDSDTDAETVKVFGDKITENELVLPKEDVGS
jgi:hypothetical protein